MLNVITTICICFWKSEHFHQLGSCKAMSNSLLTSAKCQSGQYDAVIHRNYCLNNFEANCRIISSSGLQYLHICFVWSELHFYGSCCSELIGDQFIQSYKILEGIIMSKWTWLDLNVWTERNLHWSFPGSTYYKMIHYMMERCSYFKD